MTPGIGSILFAVVSFVVTFTVARALAKWFKKRQAEKEKQAAAKNQSRQVRRAKERSNTAR